MKAVSVGRLPVLIALLALAAIFVPAGSARTSDAGVPTLYVQDSMNCPSRSSTTGEPVSSIAPGTYEVEVSTPIMFKLVNTMNQALAT